MDDQTTPRRDGEPYVPTTTHAQWGAGHPRLLVRSADARFEYPLTPDLVRIGSAEGSDVRLPDIAPLHATVQHDEQDEYVVTLHGEGEMNARTESAAKDGAHRTETLRTGARFTAGPWTFVFMRDEFADHGRPYGGREGGEGAHQQPQPARPDYRTAGTAEPVARAQTDIDAAARRISSQAGGTA